MKFSELAFFVVFGFATAFMVTESLRERRKKKRAVGSLGARLQHEDEQFARAYFRDPKLADIAVRARRVLSQNLKMDLNGLTPNDRLNEDLNAELALNPHLFWELESEFGIRTGVEDDLQTFEKTLERLVTFQDLVEFLQRKIAEPRTERSTADEDEKPSRAYELGIHSIPMFCFGGLLIVVVGIVLQNTKMINVGALIFMFGFAIWGFANGGELIRRMIHAIRHRSLKEIASHPLPLILFACLILFFLWMGYVFSRGILKNVLPWR